MAKIAIGLAVVLCFLTPTNFFGQSDQELLEFLGILTFVDYDQERITVQATDGKEAIFEVSNETEILYIDPETEEEEAMELEDLEPGFTMLIRYDIGEEDSYLARVIEIRSLGLGNERGVSRLTSPFEPEPPIRVAGVHLRSNEAMLLLPHRKSGLRENK